MKLFPWSHSCRDIRAILPLTRGPARVLQGSPRLGISESSNHDETRNEQTRPLLGGILTLKPANIWMSGIYLASSKWSQDKGLVYPWLWSWDSENCPHLVPLVLGMCHCYDNKWCTLEQFLNLSTSIVHPLLKGAAFGVSGLRRYRHLDYMGMTHDPAIFLMFSSYVAMF